MYIIAEPTMRGALTLIATDSTSDINDSVTLSTSVCRFNRFCLPLDSVDFDTGIHSEYLSERDAIQGGTALQKKKTKKERN